MPTLIKSAIRNIVNSNKVPPDASPLFNITRLQSHFAYEAATGVYLHPGKKNAQSVLHSSFAEVLFEIP